MNKITVTGYHKCLDSKTAEETGDIIRFLDVETVYKITSEIASYLDSNGDANYILIDEIPASEFTTVS